MPCAGLAALALLPALLAACAPTAAPEGEPVPPAAAPSAASPSAVADVLNGSEWRVFEIDGAGLVADSAPSLRFAEGRLSGMASCNRFTGRYSIGAGGSLGIAQLASTMMACPEPLMRQEDRYLRLLGQARSYRTDAGVLTLTDGDGRHLRARK